MSCDLTIKSDDRFGQSADADELEAYLLGLPRVAPGGPDQFIFGDRSKGPYMEIDLELVSEDGDFLDAGDRKERNYIRTHIPAAFAETIGPIEGSLGAGSRRARKRPGERRMREGAKAASWSRAWASAKGSFLARKSRTATRQLAQEVGGGQGGAEGESFGCGLDLCPKAEVDGRGEASRGEGELGGMVLVVLSAAPPVSCEEKIASAREASRMLAARALFPELVREKLRP